MVERSQSSLTMQVSFHDFWSRIFARSCELNNNPSRLISCQSIERRWTLTKYSLISLSSSWLKSLSRCGIPGNLWDFQILVFVPPQSAHRNSYNAIHSLYFSAPRRCEDRQECKPFAMKGSFTESTSVLSDRATIFLPTLRTKLNLDLKEHDRSAPNGRQLKTLSDSIQEFHHLRIFQFSLFLHCCEFYLVWYNLVRSSFLLFTPWRRCSRQLYWISSDV